MSLKLKIAGTREKAWKPRVCRQNGTLREMRHPKRVYSVRKVDQYLNSEGYQHIKTKSKRIAQKDE